MYKNMISGKKKNKNFKNNFLKCPLNETLGNLSDVSKRKRKKKKQNKINKRARYMHRMDEESSSS